MEFSYPKPDRSNVRPNFEKNAENDALDIGWHEGVLSDGRPFRAEYWCQDQISVITFFFSTAGLENNSKEGMEELLVSEHLVKFKPGMRAVAVQKFMDPSGNELWSINVVIGDEENTFVEDSIPFKAYSRS